MPRNQTIGSLTIADFDDIFNANSECIVKIPLSELHPPEFHPFQVIDDEAMQRLVNSVKKYGVREPGIVRPREDGGYELLSGNRRKRACELVGITAMPVKRIVFCSLIYYLYCPMYSAIALTNFFSVFSLPGYIFF